MYFLLVASLETAMNNMVVSNEQWKVEPQFIYIHKKHPGVLLFTSITVSFEITQP